MAPLQGQCLCGKVQVTIADGSLPLAPLACHCYNCRTTASSTLSLVAIVALDDLTIDGKEHVGRYMDAATRSGNTTQRFFCRECGSPVHTQGPSRPGKTVVKLGLFAGKLPLQRPGAEIFCANMEGWEQTISDAKHFDYLAAPPAQQAK